MKDTIKKIIIHLLFLIMGFILASCAIDGVITQDLAICGNLGAKSNSIQFVNTTNTDNFFYDTTLLYYENATNLSEPHINQFNQAEFIYYGVNLPQTPTLSFGPTVDTNYIYSLVFWFNSVKKPTLGFSVWLRKEFTLTVARTSQSYNNYYSIQIPFSKTDNLVGNYREWKVNPSLATGDLIVFTFETGFTNVYTSRPFDNITYSVGGEQLYDAGYNQGYSEGQDVGYNNGYNDGYDKALDEGISNPEHIFYTIWSILTTCGDLLYDFFTIPLFGDVTVGFVLIIIPFGFSLIENVIKIIVRLVSMFLGGN